jgi:IS30 family transposase
LKEIGQRLKKDKSSISRELKRGKKNRRYNPVTAEERSKEARKRQWPRLKVTDEIGDLIKPKLEKRW